MLTRDEYVAAMKRRLDQWGAEMDALEDDARESKGDTKAKHREQLSALRAKCADAEKKLAAIKSTFSPTFWRRIV